MASQPVTGRPGGRERLLRAAVDIAAESGAQAVTLDAVAARAGVSKGGLLYHFRTKEALLRAIVEQLTDDYREAVRDAAQRDSVPAGRSARAYVTATATTRPSSARDAAFIAVAATRPELMAPWRELAAEWLAEDRADDADAVDLLVARLAADGLWLADLLGVYGVENSRLRRRVVARIRALTTPADTA
jgi:AcrR family transcriptional regulator